MNLLALKGMSDGVTALFTFVLGLLVIFLGMAIIIVFLSIIGKVFDKINGKTSTRREKTPKTEAVTTSQVVEDDIDEKTRVAIVSAIYAYYQQEDNGGCEFVVRKINKKR